MQRLRWILLILAAATAGALLIAYTLGKARPDIPADELHISLRAQPSQCLACHGPGGAHPRSPNHPAGRGSCEQCHYWKGEAR